SIHTHHLGLPVEVRRFSTGASASIGRGRGAQVSYDLTFVCTDSAGNQIPAAVGFVGDVDGIQVKFEYPARVQELCAREERLTRALRPARFRDLVRADPTLDAIANDFQRDWLAQVYLSAISAEALRKAITLEEAEAALHSGSSSTTLREVLETILQWSEAEDDPDAAHQAPNDLPRRLQELLDLLDLVTTREALHQASRVLWEGINDDWEPWLRIRFKSTLGAALVEAAHGLCPRMGEDALILDLPPTTGQTQNDALPTRDR